MKPDVLRDLQAEVDTYEELRKIGGLVETERGFFCYHTAERWTGDRGALARLIRTGAVKTERVRDAFTRITVVHADVDAEE